MPVTITFRLNEEDKAHEMSLDELKARIASGTIGPKALVCYRVVTNGEWWSLDNLNLFHTHSPVHHEAGGHLRKKRQMQDEKQYAEKVQADWTRKVLESLPETIVDDCLGFEPFERILGSSETIGVTRLIRCPAFGGIVGVTIVFKKSESLVLTATAAKNPKYKLTAPTIEWINSEIPNWKVLAKRFLAEEVKRQEKHLPLQSLLTPLNNWSDAKTAVQLAPNCVTPTLDGYIYFHRASELGWKMTSSWSNPRHDLTPVQAKLVDAYMPFLSSFLR
ncbi:MAG: hypothetical protein H7X97_10115 [Opitutaceae bacterium]|nr:hypothetical protein [Verrucomicrobiales bacterium]